MEGSVLIEVNAPDATEYGEDREVVADNDQRGVMVVVANDSVHPFPSPVCHIDEPFSSRDDQLRRLLSPLLDKAGVGGADVRKGQPLEFSVVEFAEAVLDRQRQAVGLADRLGCLDGSFQTARINGFDSLSAERLRQFLRLSNADRIKL